MTKKINTAMVDSSVLICKLKGEPAANLFLGESEMGKIDNLFISAVTHTEVILATMSLHA